MAKRRIKRTAESTLRILAEDRMTLKAAAAKLNVAYETVRKYATVGYPVTRGSVRDRVVLESIRTGGKIETSNQAIGRFICEINQD